MPLVQAQQYAPSTFDELNPWYSAIKAKQDMYAKALGNQDLEYKNSMDKIDSDTYADQLKQKMLKGDISNKMDQSNLDFNPAMLGSEIKLREAQAKLANENADLGPSKLAIQAKMADARNSQNAHAMGSLLLAFANSDYGKNLSAHNPDFAKKLLDVQNYASSFIPPTPPMTLPPPTGQRLDNLKNNVGNDAPLTLTDDQTEKLFKSHVDRLSGNNNQVRLPDDHIATKLNNTIYPQSDVEAIQSAGKDAYINATVPKPIIQQRYFDKSIDNMLNSPEISKRINNALELSGLAGRKDIAISTLLAGLKRNNDPRFTDYNTFVNSDAKIIANEFLRAFGGRATDKQIEDAHSIADPTSWRKNPDLAIARMQALVDNLRANSQSINSSPSQVQEQSQQENKSINPFAIVKVQTKNGIVAMPYSGFRNAKEKGHDIEMVGQ